MSLYYSAGSETTELSSADLESALSQALDRIGDRKRVLAIPPDFTRRHSRAGELTRYARNYLGDRLTHIMPAIGTHTPMSAGEIERMFGDVPPSLFHVHDWRKDIVTLGEVPAAFVCQQSEGKLDFPWPAQVNRLLVNGNFDLILSLGQVVPHEVIGMANYNKNVLIGTGGPEAINRSHFLGAVYGMERIMGRADNPVRRVLNYASDHFLRHLPIVYVLTVVSRNAAGRLVTRGLFVGDDIECFERAAQLSVAVNFQMLDHPVRKAVVFLDPDEYKSTWLGNKSVYRMRMALADGGELIVIAPGVKEFGEDHVIDVLIRRYGYFGTPATLQAIEQDPELADNLGAAAHLIHGSSEGRFNITYCTSHLTKEEIEAVGFRWSNLDEMTARYNSAKCLDGYNTIDGEEIFFVSNPATGLWAEQTRLT